MTAAVLPELLKGDERGERTRKMEERKKKQMGDGKSDTGQGWGQGCGTKHKCQNYTDRQRGGGSDKGRTE